MFSECANPECGTPLVHGEGRYFRFPKSCAEGQQRPNTHSVQHFWLCDPCCRQFTLELQDGSDVVLRTRRDIGCQTQVSRRIAAA